jgi:mono/diheme cytochrome c family protein
MAPGLWFLWALMLFFPSQAGAYVRIAVPPPVPPASTPAVDTALYARGKQVYLSQYCGVCHTLAAAGTRGVFGPAHDGLARTAQNRLADTRYAGAATTVEEYIRESIVAPSAFVAVGGGPGRQAMPPFSHLPAADIDVLVYFLAQQK